MQHTRVKIEVTVFSDCGNETAYPRYGEPSGTTRVIIFPCENYGDLLEQMVERATDEYIDNVEGAKGLDE